MWCAMKKIILLLTTAMLLYVSSSALEPIRIGLNYPTGATFRVQLKDYTDPGNPIQKYPLAGNQFNKALIPNSSGVVSFVVGEGDPDWGNLTAASINSNYIVDVRVGPNLIAQFNLLEVITTQASTGNGDILNDGFTSSGGVTFSDTSSSNITNDFLFGSIKLDRLSNVDETKFFFDYSKAAFRAGVVSTDSWNEANIGNNSFAAGKDTKASGEGAVAFGVGTSAPSYGEMAIGSYNTTYTPASTTTPDDNDRAFVIGNGTSATPSNALVIQKNGNMTVGGSLTVLGATVTNSNLNVGGTSIDPNTGNLIVAGTSTLNGDVSITADKTLTVGIGLTSLGGGLTVSAGTVSLPNDAIVDAEVVNTLTIDGGTIDNTPIGAGGASTGAFTTLDATTVTTTGLITAGNAITATTGNITATAGNVVGVDGTFSGNVTGATATTTGLITAGNAITATTGNITATAGNVVGVDGTFSGNVTGATATTTGLITAGNGLTVTTGNITATAGNVVGVDGTFSGNVTGATATTTGLITAGNAITATTGNITATAGNVVGVDGTFSGNVTGATATTTGLITAGNGLTVTTGNTTLTSLGTAGNRSLYVDDDGLVTASNGSAARQASGMTTGIFPVTVAGAIQTVTNSAVKTGSVIIVTFQGVTDVNYRITAITDGTSFELTFSASVPIGEKIHYMIINN